MTSPNDGITNLKKRQERKTDEGTDDGRTDSVDRAQVVFFCLGDSVPLTVHGTLRMTGTFLGSTVDVLK